jgi:hypothetical protein
VLKAKLRRSSRDRTGDLLLGTASQRPITR